MKVLCQLILGLGLVATGKAQHSHAPGSNHAPHGPPPTPRPRPRPIPQDAGHPHGPGIAHAPHGPEIRMPDYDSHEGNVMEDEGIWWVDWKSGEPYPPIEAIAGQEIVFHYGVGHNIVAWRSKTDFDTCNVMRATEIASSSLGGGSGSRPNRYSSKLPSKPGPLYLSTSTPGACQSGMKVVVNIISPATAAMRDRSDHGHSHDPKDPDYVAHPPADPHDHPHTPGEPHAPHGPATPTDVDYRTPELSYQCSGSGASWNLVGHGYCRPQSCTTCANQHTLESFCVDSLLACQQECEANENCQGVAYIERVNHADGDKCQASNLGRCIHYNSDSLTVGGTQSSSRQEYICLSKSEGSSGGSGGDCAQTETKAAPKFPPSQVRSLAVTGRKPRQVTLVWAPPSDNFVPGVDSYVVTGKSVRTGNQVKGLTIIDKLDSTVTVTGLMPKNGYRFEVVAKNSKGSSTKKSILVRTL